MKLNWPKKKLGAVADLCLGKMLDKQKNKGAYHSYLGNVHVRWGTFDLQELPQMRFEDHEHDRYGLRHGDLIVCEGGEPGRCALWKDQLPSMKFQKALHRVRPHPCLDSNYLLYWFLHAGQRDVFNQYCTGATIKHLPGEKLAIVEVDVPPLPMQRRIASILSAYDDLIENNTQRIQILERMAQLVYREWFVQFRFPGHAKTKLVPSPIGKIPQGWEPRTLGDLAQELRRTIDPDELEPNTPYIGLEHMPRKSIALTDWGSAKEVQSTKLRFDKGDILFGKIRPYFHKVGVAAVNGVCSTDAIVITPKQPEHFALVLACVSSEPFVSHATQTSQGTKMPRANWNVLTKYPLPLPPKPLLSQFSSLTNDSVALIQNLVFKNRNLRRTRDLLLPKLISGALDVSKLDIEKA